MASTEPELPIESALAEIERIRGLFREALAAYSARFEADLDALQQKIQGLATAGKIPHGCLRDLRDMLTLLRNASVKTTKGRRKELKKLDSLVADLQMITEGW